MELYQLKCFLEVAKQENISRAAETMHISQPALSISIRKLESEVGTELFHRKGRSIRLSARGRSIIPYVERILAYESEIVSACKNNWGPEKEIFIETHAAIPVIIDVVSRFHHNHPEIKIRMTNENINGEVPDIIIGATEIVPSQGLDVILKEHIVLAIPRILNQSYDVPVTSEFISENTLIGISRNYSFSTIEEHYMAVYYKNLRHSIICDNPAMLRNLLNNGTGVAFVPSKTWALQKNPAIKLERIDGPEWPFYITVERTGFRTNKALVELFVSELALRFADL